MHIQIYIYIYVCTHSTLRDQRALEKGCDPNIILELRYGIGPQIYCAFGPEGSRCIDRSTDCQIDRKINRQVDQ